MRRRRAWKGNPPGSQADARRLLLDVARNCVERFGLAKTSLSDVAEAAGVTRQTVYRHFDTADDLFQAAAVLASGGFRDRLRQRVRRRGSLAERMVETLVVAVSEISRDPQLRALMAPGGHFAVSPALRLAFVQEETLLLAEGDLRLGERERDELAEIFLRLLHSFLSDPGEPRSEEELRVFLYRWLVPMIEEKLGRSR